MATQNNEKISLENKEQNQNLPILSENKQKFFNRVKIDNSIKEQTKNNILKLLQNEKLTDDDFDSFLGQDEELIGFITERKEIKDIKKYVDSFLGSFEKRIFPEDLIKKEEKLVEIKNDEKEAIKENNIIQKTNEEVQKTNEEVQKTNALNILSKNSDKYKKVFVGDREFLDILNNFNELRDLKNYKGTPEEHLKQFNENLTKLENYLKVHGKEFFAKLAKEAPEIYDETFNALSNLSSTIAESIKIYETKAITDIDPIISQFPDVKDGEITKRGDIVSFGDKTIDLRDKKAYISGENGYKLETSISLPDTLDLKAEYLARKLEIKETINTDKRILELLGNKKKIKKDIEDLEKEKKGGLGEDIGINIAINLLQKELEQIQAKLAVAVPNYKENQDELLTSFLENSIKENEENLAKLEEKYRKDISELYEKSADKVKENDETTRQTVLLLDSIGFTLIPKHITDDIIATINKNPEHYGFDSRIDLKNGNFGGPNTILTKERFIKKFNKMISGKEGEPITTDDINNILVKKLEKDKDSQAERNKELLAKFSTYNIMSDLGTWDREKLESNLILKEKETTNK